MICDEQWKKVHPVFRVIMEHLMPQKTIIFIVKSVPCGFIIVSRYIYFNNYRGITKISKYRTALDISDMDCNVPFLHAARDLFTAWPAYSVHHCAQSFRADFSDSACK